MGYEFTAAEVAFLRSPRAEPALAAAADLPLSESSMLADLDRLRRRWPQHAAAVAETVRLRRAAAAKLTGARRWLLTDTALQQATPSAVAAHRAGRLAGRIVHDVTCSIGADLAETAARAAVTLGSDTDPVRLAMAQHNLGASEAAGGAALLLADALTPVSRSAVISADPGRRSSSGKRTRSIEQLQPPIPQLLAAYAGRDMVLKAAPGLDADVIRRVRADCEVELISLNGGVREACLWFGGLRSTGASGQAVGARATVLRSDAAATGTDPGPETLTDADPEELQVDPGGDWIVDPDGAVVRAGLVRQYAARHGLRRMDEHLAYLTGPRRPEGVRAFRVLDSGHYSVKALRELLRGWRPAAVEILVRGLDVNPDRLRAQLRLPQRRAAGCAALTVVLARLGSGGNRRSVMYLCRAEPR